LGQPNVTLTIYAHVVEGSGRVAVDALGDRLKAPIGGSE
jgi:hypothetical protein